MFGFVLNFVFIRTDLYFLISIFVLDFPFLLVLIDEIIVSLELKKKSFQVQIYSLNKINAPGFSFSTLNNIFVLVRSKVFLLWFFQCTQKVEQIFALRKANRFFLDSIADEHRYQKNFKSSYYSRVVLHFPPI